MTNHILRLSLHQPVPVKPTQKVKVPTPHRVIPERRVVYPSQLPNKRMQVAIKGLFSSLQSDHQAAVTYPDEWYYAGNDLADCWLSLRPEVDLTSYQLEVIKWLDQNGFHLCLHGWAPPANW